MASTAGRALVAEGDRLVAEALAAHLRRDGFQPVSLLQLSARMRGKAGSALPSTNGKASARRVPAKKYIAFCESAVASMQKRTTKGPVRASKTARSAKTKKTARKKPR